jgi:hypothetical protein
VSQYHAEGFESSGTYTRHKYIVIFLCFLFFLELNRENRALLDRLVSAWAASRDDDATRTGAMGRALRRLVVAVLSRPGRTRGALALVSRSYYAAWYFIACAVLVDVLF